ncbi:uncharacterized protein Z518_06305 [Rhinocladiella mackenziei CBS 650.93]|uniref:Zn(2)-C6 fungal-type domain-containing protein n=1 Tax=Rhinocladiella mackenziei CBS 650.93 TaxID=1442369 RepID=A0A0D2H4V2_9EURO|nr:uncharacterized protein Z518_06305 [Rhinocladiella mackenziei CBS 650.93]KIX05433.1 hypothetical protein Z518_06305 [Rhinocladiella mackenziei CBS 650.93]
MFRSTQGCWTCRLRHKKCDETHPFCQVCTSRDIQCDGYNEKPAWLDGGLREQQYRAEIKQAVKRNFKLKKRGVSNFSTVAEGNSAANSREEGGPVSSSTPGPQRQSTVSVSRQRPNLPGAPASTPDIITQLTPLSDTPTSLARFPNEQAQTSELVGRRVTNYRDAELVMHYFDHVFPLQFRFHTQDLNGGGRGWLLWLLVKSGPLYHATLSLSALHQFTLRFHNQGDKYAELKEYHTTALRDLQLFLQHTQESGGLDERSRQIEVLACGVSLISFELFRGGVSDWQPHLNALASIVAALENDPANSRQIEGETSFQQAGGSMQMEDAALPFLIAVVLWFDLVSCASTGSAPRLSYTSLMVDHKIDLAGVMGCQNWAMAAIGDLAWLNAWKKFAQQSGALNIRELVVRGRRVEEKLGHGLAMLDSQNHFELAIVSRTSSGRYPNFSCSYISIVVTRVFACAALVQLRTIVSGSFPDLPEVCHAVDRTISALQQVKDPQDMRGLIWPICISGCMAGPSRQSFFESLIKSVLGNGQQDFGNSATILRVMKKCWESRLMDPSQEWDWARAMAEMGICGLLV